MNQEQFSQLICELAFQLNNDPEIKLDHEKFIKVFNTSKHCQDTYVQFMVEQTIEYMNKK